MAYEIENLPVVTTPQEIFEQVAALLALNGMTIDAEVMAYLQPLLEGSQNYAEHRATLEAMLAEIAP